VALKDSALGYLIGYVEVVRSGQQLGAFYGNYLPALIVVAIIMIALNSTLTVVATRVEKRLRSGRKGGAIPPADIGVVPAVSVPGLDITDKRL
jgi:glutamate transport system permease protein